MDNIIKQLACLLFYGLDKWFVFDPLGEFVDADVDVAKTSRRGLEWPNHIQSLACKEPRCRNRLQGLSWDVDLFSEKLVVLTSANECFSISYG